ncbi:malonyl CoA-acyl carrier protein transacylase [Aspergillus campestris IBT 28561]|uniref:[acyl-carrier-protein] S-malonyltransferase n=1 Tax=Aspergillus campestris (strain IBT 28561) TaxID=1392248 RepID=A0A2I1CW39_ASPC2|nr:malonyl CoA-acyl carrier protein transacylase [Aspergillus campestris IBT 28561]PKY01841.1 malonyl CoA-acyl carrier protein transacylase [Aspergillus campestris IBT 28561]
MLAALAQSKYTSALRVPWHHYPCAHYSLQYRRLHGTVSCAHSAMRTALFFPGHGVQRVGMAKPWVDGFPTLANRFLDEMDSILGFRLSRIISEGPNSELNKTENTQPAIMATSILILRILEEHYGFDTRSRVNVTLGHSLGEFSALVAGGYLDFSDALRLVRRRAVIMAQCTQRVSEAYGGDYGMVALVCEPDHMDGLLAATREFLNLAPSAWTDDSTSGSPSIQQVMLANINSRNQIVLSGSIEKIRTLLIQLRQFGGHDPRAVRLKSESPFHNPIMAPAACYMRHALEQIDLNFPAHFPCISNVSGLPFSSRSELKRLLSEQCVETVRWWDSVRYLDIEQGVKRWIGIGPGKVGRNLVGKEVGKVMAKGGGVWAVCDPRELEAILYSLEQTEHDY